MVEALAEGRGTPLKISKILELANADCAKWLAMNGP